MERSDFFEQKSEQVITWKNEGKMIKATLKEQANEILDSITDSEGIIDGKKLADTWFPIVNKDIFLSYSHDDEDLALILAGMLKDLFGLNVFIDELVWGSADELLKAIDEKYCIQSNGNYNYNKRNLSTSHVHAMLTTAIARAIDQTETVFFLNTDKSAYKLEGVFSKERTLSPWIYEEIMLANVLRKRDWDEHRQSLVNEAYHFEKSLQVSYLLETDGFTKITFLDLVNWYKAWEKRKVNDTGRYGTVFLKEYEKIKHPLNVLYELSLGVDETRELIH